MLHTWQRHRQWGRFAPSSRSLLLGGGLILATFLLLRWVWASVVGVYFSSIVVIPWGGAAAGDGTGKAGGAPDFAGMFFHALALAGEMTLLVLLLLSAVAYLVWRGLSRGWPASSGFDTPGGLRSEVWTLDAHPQSRQTAAHTPSWPIVPRHLTVPAPHAAQSPWAATARRPHLRRRFRRSR